MKKSVSKGNSSILNFFKPSSQDAAPQKTQTASQAPIESQSSPKTLQMSDEQPTPSSSMPEYVPRSQGQPTSSALKNGKTVVRSSDSEDSDDSSGLDDLDIVIGKKRAIAATTSRQLKTPIKTRSTFKFDASPIPARPKLRVKNDLAALVKQAEKERREEANSEAYHALLNEKAPDPTDIDDLDAEGLLEDVMGGDDTEKLVQALKRQKAGNVESRWFFFDTGAAPKDTKRSEFPKQALNKCPWKSALTNPSLNSSTFRQTINSGFANEMVAMGEELPEELLLWMLDEICFESKESFRHSYCQIISGHPSRTISRLMNPDLIKKLFRNLRSTEEATNTTQGIGPIRKLLSVYEDHSWDQLTSVVFLLGSVATSLSNESRNYSVCLLARLCMDNIVFEKLGLFQTIQNSIKSLIHSIPEGHWISECDVISQTIFNFTKSSTLQLQIIQCIPDEGNSRLHQIRIKLARSIYFADPNPLSTPFTLPSITKNLSPPRFLINSSVDYRELSSLISILDIAVGSGLSPNQDLSTPSLENAFNAEVDKLVVKLESISSAIRDATAAHEARTDAKNVIKVVLLRLGTMRTRRKPRVTIWGAESEARDLKVEDVEMMERFASSLQKIQEGAK